MFKSCVIAVAVLTAAASASAAESGENEKPAKEKLICHTELATGSRVRKTRICMTEAQWREKASATEQGINKYARDAAVPAKASGPFGG